MRVTDIRTRKNVLYSLVVEVEVDMGSSGLNIYTRSGYLVHIEPEEWNAMRDEVDRDHANGRL